MPLVRRSENRDMLPTVSLVRLPGITENKKDEDTEVSSNKTRTDENVKQLFCANCGLHDDSIVHMMVVDIKTKIPQQQVNANLGQPNNEKRKVVLDVHEALSSIYRLEYLEKFPSEDGDNFKNNEEPMVICKSCAAVLTPLYKLLLEFDLLRAVDSILQQKILKFDSRLEKILQNGLKEEPNSDEEEEEENNSQFKQVQDSEPTIVENSDEKFEEEIPVESFLPVEILPGDHASFYPHYDDDEIDVDEEEEKCTHPSEPEKVYSITTPELPHLLDIVSPLPPPEDPQILHCPNCCKEFVSSRNLEAHNKICNRVKMSSKLRTTKKMKTVVSSDDDDDEKPEGFYKCFIWSNPFPSKTKMTHHIWAEHVQTKSKPQRSIPLTPTTTTPTECKVCNKKFKNSFNLACHMKAHRSRPDHKYDCRICGKIFPHPAHLRVHMLRHMGIRPFKCPDCGKSFVGPNVLRAHQRVHHAVDKAAFKCSVCQKGFPVQSLLRSHVQHSHQKDLYPCPTCKRRFASKTGQANHITQCRDSRQRVCPVCGKVYASKKHYTLHMKIHEETGTIPCPRPKCEQEFDDKLLLKDHLKNHVSRCPAPDCDKTFSAWGYCRSHVQAIHPELVEDPDKITHVCSVCGLKIIGAARLKSHMTKSHGERIHKCELCESSFKTMGALKCHHVRVHGDGKERIHRCGWCDKSFYTPTDVRNHEKTHTGEKSFECQVCHKFFRLSCNLRKHSFIHSEGKFNCTVCGKVFKQPQSLKTHMRTHNKKKQ